MPYKLCSTPHLKTKTRFYIHPLAAAPVTALTGRTLTASLTRASDGREAAHLLNLLLGTPAACAHKRGAFTEG